MSHRELELERQVAQLEGLTTAMFSRMNEMEEQLKCLASDSAHVAHRILQNANPNIDSGDTAWMLSATGLVLSMTIPGLMLYYSGMVRSKNVLATVMQIFSITCLITVLWLAFGYSLAFGPANADGHSSPVIGNASRFWLQGMSDGSTHQLAPTIPETVFCVYQMSFAIITPSLIVGAFADRMKIHSMLLFIGLWHLLVYCPVAHSMWHPEGFLFKAGVLDYAGGNVVHIASGVSGLVSIFVIGNRIGFGTEEFEPHNILFTSVGSCLLWVGWFGFNAGSAYAASEHAGDAMLMTQIATATAALSWLATEWWVRKQPSVLGMVSGAVCGLVAVTPGAGYIFPTGAFCIGLIAGPVCYFGIQAKHYFGYDDSLDAFGVHAIAGCAGGILTGFFATDRAYTGDKGVFYASTAHGGTQLGVQIYGIVVTVGWSMLLTFIILKSIDLTIGLRVTDEQETQGLDQAIYRESVFSKVMLSQLAPSVEEPVNIRFSSSHGRNVVQEITQSHGAQLLPMDSESIHLRESQHGRSLHGVATVQQNISMHNAKRAATISNLNYHPTNTKETEMTHTNGKSSPKTGLGTSVGTAEPSENGSEV